MLELVLAQARYEIGNAVRNGEQLLVSLGLPAFALVGLQRLSPESAFIVAVIVAVTGTCLTSLSISLAYDRRYGAIKAFAMSPLGTTGYLVGRTIALLVICGLQALALLAAATGFGIGTGVGALGGIAVLSLAVTGSGLAFWMASRLRAEAVLALTNLLFVAIGGTSAGRGFDAAASWSEWSPAGLVLKADGGDLAALGLLGILAVAAIAAAARYLRLD